MKSDNKPLIALSAKISIWQLVVGCVGMIIMLLGLGLSYLSLQSNVTRVDTHVDRLQKDVKATQFTIIEPSDRALVPLTGLVRGRTPFKHKNHYIVVRPLKTGDDWVQDGPVKVSLSGVWTGTARFGEAGVGAEEEYMVRALATKSNLLSGPLAEVPGDAIFSESIIVTRQD